MASTLVSGSLNTYSAALTNGTIPANHFIPHYTDWADALAPWETPFLNWISKGEAINQPTFYWGQSYLPELQSAVGSGGIDSSSGTTALPVAAGTGLRFMKWDVIGLFDAANESNDPDEVMWVTADPTANGLTVLRAQQGTSATAFSEHERIMIIGHAEPQNQDHNESSILRGDRQSNVFQRFADGVSADIAARNTPTYEFSTDPLLMDFEVKQRKQKRLLERAILYNGAPVVGTPQVGSQVASQMGGINNYISTNVVDASGALLTKRLFSDTLSSLYESVDDSMAKVFVMSYRTKALINTWFNPITLVTDNRTIAQEQVNGMATDFGTFEFKAFQNFPNGVIYILDPSEIIYHPYAGCDWHVSHRRGEDHGADHDHMYFSGDFSVEVRNEAALARFYNFETDIDQYADFSTGILNVNVTTG